MSVRRIVDGADGGASITIAPYEHPVVLDFIGSGRYLQVAFCKSVMQLYSAKFGALTRKDLSNIAAEAAHVEMLKWSKEIGCLWNENVFSSGARGGSVDILGFLLDNECPIPKDAIPCTEAAKGGHLEALKFLSFCGCRWNFKTFAAATGEGHLNVLQFLYRFRCAVDPRQVCSLAIENEHMHILQWVYQTLHQHGLIDEEACWMAASMGRLEILKWLRSVGCKWDSHTCWEAISEGHIDALQFALDEGCPDIDAHGRTCLHFAAMRERTDMLEFLLSRGANNNLDSVDEDGWSALYTAATLNNAESVRVLIHAGADVNKPDFEGLTPLGAAISEASYAVVEVLRAVGARE